MILSCVAIWLIYAPLMLNFCLGNYFAEFEEAMNQGVGFLKTAQMNDEVFAALDKPKEIEIICPGDPVVTIKDLVSESKDYDGECIVVRMTGPNFNFRFSLNCNDGDSYD